MSKVYFRISNSYHRRTRALEEAPAAVASSVFLFIFLELLTVNAMYTQSTFKYLQRNKLCFFKRRTGPILTITV